MSIFLNIAVFSMSLFLSVFSWLPPSGGSRSESRFPSVFSWLPPSGGSRSESRRTWWPDGTLKSVAHYHADVDVLHGEYRTWYASGQPYELRHFDRGRESGAQRSWTETGELYLNYEVRNGRRYGYINARPCVPVAEGHP